MIIRKIKNKKGMSISIVILTFATLALTVFSLLVFSFHGTDLSENVNLADLDRVYAIEELVNFYVDLMIENSIEENIDENKFIENFKKEFDNYKQGDDFVLEELRQIEEQINNENIEFEQVNRVNKKVIVNLEISIEDEIVKRNGEQVIVVKYNYQKTFDKEI